MLKSERDKVVAANQEPIYSIPGTNDRLAIASIHIQGIGHEYWIKDDPGGDRISAIVAFLLALDDDPGK